MKTTCERCNGTGQHSAGFGGGTCDCDTCCGRGYLGQDEPPAPKATLDLRGLSEHGQIKRLNAAVAHYVLGHEVDLSLDTMRLPDETMGGQSFESWISVPAYCTSADAILPLLYREHWRVDQTSVEARPIRVSIDGREPGGSGESDRFPMAAAIGLLRAYGVEVLT